jgi:predicted nucleic acid-binding protein
MSNRKIRAFVDTNVLLEYIAGKPEIRRLFSKEVLERAAFAINAVVLQELLLARNEAPAKVDLTTVIPFLEVVGAGVDLASSATQAELRRLRNYVAHSNDVFILAGARACDVLLTYDRELLKVGEVTDVRSETPEQFLDELDHAA